MQLISSNLADVAFCSWRHCRINGARSSVSNLLELFSAAKMSVADILVDESMVQFWRHLKFCQYMPGKTHKYGIKLCDPDGRLTMASFNVYQTLQKKAWLPRCRWHCEKNIFKLMMLLLPTSTIQAYLLRVKSTIWLELGMQTKNIYHQMKRMHFRASARWVAGRRWKITVQQHSVPTVVSVQGMLVGQQEQHFYIPVLTSGMLQTTYIE